MRHQLEELAQGFEDLERILDEIGMTYAETVLEAFDAERNELRAGTFETMQQIRASLPESTDTDTLERIF